MCMVRAQRLPVAWCLQVGSKWTLTLTPHPSPYPYPYPYPYP